MRASLVAAVAAAVISMAASAPARPHPSACKNVITGTVLPESLEGTPGNDRILGLAGDDRLIGRRGNDCLNGGLDSDQLIGSAGDDRVVGSSGEDALEGDAGADDLVGQQDGDRLDGGAGADRLWGGGAVDVLRGGAGGDVLRGGDANDRLFGGAGRDALFGGPGNDYMTEVPARYSAVDSLDTGRNRIAAGPGRDTIDVANGRRDVIECGAGRDTVKADKGDRLRHCERRRYLISPFPTVSPARGGRKRAFLVKLRSIQPVGPSADYFSISVKGPRGCGSLEATSIGMRYHADRGVRYRLRPFRGRGRKAKRWCSGRYRGVVSYSRPGAADMRIGRFSFRVHG
jgi:hypothetical protein